jgi:hypothetical protein
MAPSETIQRNFVRQYSIKELLSSVFMIYTNNIFTILIMSIIHIVVNRIPVVGLLSSIFLSAIVLVCSRYALGRPIQLLEIYKNVLWSKYVFSLFVGAILFVIVITMPIAFLMQSMGSPIIGIVLMPFQFLLLFYFASIVLIEKRGLLEAIGRVFTLLFTNIGRTIMYFYICALIFYIVPGIVLSLMNINIITDFSWLGSILFNPFLYIATVLLYYDARVQKENFTQELLAQDLGYEVSAEVIGV